MIASRGERAAAYIRTVIDTQRKMELGSRAVLLLSLFPPAWIAGTVGLSISKIIENMEIGHNVMHGQWDCMHDDPKIHSTTWEWDSASPADMWKHSHNELHHTYIAFGNHGTTPSWQCRREVDALRRALACFTGGAPRSSDALQAVTR